MPSRAAVIVAAVLIGSAAPAGAQDAPRSRRNGEAPAYVLSREAAYQLRVLRTSPEPRTRAMAAAALGQERDRLVVAALITVLLSDPDASVRAAAATSLGSIGDREAIDVLREGMRDPDPSVAAAARAALDTLTTARP